MDVLSILALVAGFALLIAGGESLVRGASALARGLGMSSLVVGLTVVSFATSAPELAVSIDAVYSGAPGLAVGNVVGSNIANVLLVLGGSALIVPLLVKSQVVRSDIPVMVGLSVLLLLLTFDGMIGRVDGIVLFAVLLGYVSALVLAMRRRPSGPPARREPTSVAEPERTGGSRAKGILVNAGLVVLGAVLLVAGGRLLVSGASSIAAALGVSDLVIGLTVVAIGTSLPELVTCVLAAVRGERDMAVGNIVGSNIFNIGAVLGISGILAPAGIEVGASTVRFDLPVMLAVAVVLLPVAFTGFAVVRWEGALFAGFYAAYIVFVVLQATGSQALQPFGMAMLWFVIPLTALCLVTAALHELRSRRQRPREEHAAAGSQGPDG